MKNEQLLNENIEQMETEEDNSIFLEKRKKFILKGLSSLLSSIIYIFGCFSLWTVGNSIVYLISFRRAYDPKLTFSYGYFLIPIMNFTLSLTSPIGGIIEDKIGGRKTIFLSTSIICISFTFMYFSRKIFIDYILMCLNGFGLAVGINITRKNVCSFFMNKKALVCGIINLIPGIFCAGLNIFNEKYILNPLSENPTIDDVYFEQKIFLNFQKLIIFEIGLLIVVCFLSLLFYFQNDPKETIKFGFGEKVQENKIKKNENKKTSSGIKIKKALFNIRAFKLFLMIFSFFPLINFINNAWWPIGIYYEIDIYYLQLMGALYSLTGCLSSIIFALIGDKIQFKILFIIFSIIISIVSFIFPMSYKNSIIYILEVMTISFIYNGYNIIIDPHMMKIYGIDNYIKIGGVIRSSEGICEIMSIIFAFYLENHYIGKRTNIFKIFYIISGCLGLISVILGLSENEEKFNYDL